MLLEMLFSCVAVAPSETLVLPDCWAAGAAAADFPRLAERADDSPAGVVGNDLPGLSIFTVVLSISLLLNLAFVCYWYRQKLGNV